MLPQKNALNGRGGIQISHQAQQFSGPLPPPGMLEDYERVLPGAAERIFAMAEAQSPHRRGLEAKVIESDVAVRSPGQSFGLLVALAGFATAYLVARSGYGTAAAVIGGMDLVALVAVFVLGQERKARRLEGKRGDGSTSSQPLEEEPQP